MPVVRELITRFAFQGDTAKVQAFRASVEQTKASAVSAAGAFSGLNRMALGAAAALGLGGGGLVVLGKRAISAAADFQKPLIQAVAEAGSARTSFAERLGAMRKETLAFSNDWSIAATTVVGAFDEIGDQSVELYSKDFYNVAQAAAKLTKVLGVEMTSQIRPLIDLTRNFTGSLEDVQGTANALFAAQELGAGNLGEVQGGLSALGKSAKSTNQDMTGLLSVMIALGKQGLRGGEATMLMRRLLMAMGTKGGAAGPEMEGEIEEAGGAGKVSKVAAHLKELGVNATDAAGKFRPLPDIIAELSKALGSYNQQARMQFASELVGMRNADKLLAIFQDSGDAVKTYRAELEGSAGALDRATGEARTTALGKYNSEMNKFKNIAIDVGSIALPPLTEALKNLGAVVAAHKDEIAAFGGMAVQSFGGAVEWVTKYGKALEWAGGIWATVWIGGGVVSSFKALAPVVGAATTALSGLAAGFVAVGASAPVALALVAGEIGIIVAGIAAWYKDIQQLWAWYELHKVKQENDRRAALYHDSADANFLRLNAVKDLSRNIDRKTPGGWGKLSQEQRDSLMLRYNIGVDMYDIMQEAAIMLRPKAAGEQAAKAGTAAGKGWAEGVSKGVKEKSSVLKDSLGWLHPGFDAATMRQFQQFMGGRAFGDPRADYLGGILKGNGGPNVTNNANFHTIINGAGDPDAIADKVSRMQTDGMVRTFNILRIEPPVLMG